MNKLAILSISFAAAGLTAGCANVQTSGGVGQAQTRTGGFLGLATLDNIETKYESGFKGANQVIIGGFKVGFNDSKKFTETKNSIVGPSTSSTALVQLEGLDPSVRQQITDTAYNNFVQQLAANGYEVIERTQFTNSPAYKGAKEFDFPYKDDQSSLFSSYGVGYFYSPSQIGPKQAFFDGEIVDNSPLAGFSEMNNGSRATMNFGKDQKENIRVINVSYVIDFANGSGASYGEALLEGKLLSVDQLLAVNSGVLGISKGPWSFAANQLTGQLSIGQAIGSDIEFATVENVTTEVEAGAEIATNLITGYLTGGLTGAIGKTQNQTREFVFHVTDSNKYAQASTEVLEKANTLMVEKMAQLRDAK